MAPRKLSERQAEHVRRIQERRLARARRREQQQREKLGEELGPEQLGRVIANYGASLLIEDAEGAVRQCTARANLELPVSGDEVVWQSAGPDGGVVSALVPRRTTLTRRDAAGRPKPLAANLDRIAVVAAPRPGIDESLIDRYLAAAELAGIAPLLVVNKTDLLEAGELAALRARLGVYETIGYPVVLTSCRRAHGLDALLAELAGHTSVLVGQSGVGKSSLIKALLPDQEVRIGALSAASGQGVHTTSTTMLYHVPSGGDLIDSPGVREFDLEERDPERLAWGFAEFRPWFGKCRFRDCRHLSEPGCAVAEAAAAGRISGQRLARYRELVSGLVA